MGCMTDRNQRSIKVGSLNYSGIQNSPYEFYEENSKEERDIGEMFQTICKEHIKSFQDSNFKWQIGKLDRQWHTRLTPIYNKQCGVKDNHKLMKQAEFKQQWDKIYTKNKQELEQKLYKNLKPSQKKTVSIQKQQCKLFDFCLYQTVVCHSCKIKHQDFEKNDIDSTEYQEFQKHKFSKTYLDKQRKLDLTLKAIRQNQIDVFFIQEGDEHLAAQIHKISSQYYIKESLKQGITSMIIFRVQSFPQIQDFEKEARSFKAQLEKKLGAQMQQQLNFNKDSVLQPVGNMLFLSVHLSSKKQVNSTQLVTMKQTLAKLKYKFPHLNLIIGSDLNGPLDYGFMLNEDKQIKTKIQVFPDKQQSITCYKMRTSMQAQKNKANVRVSEVKDYIISDLQILGPKITTINNIEVKKGQDNPYLPHDRHPYDHYLLTARIEYPMMTRDRHVQSRGSQLIDS